MRRARVTGIGVGFAGAALSADWEYKESEAEIARRVLLDCEERRVLYGGLHAEDADHCRQSADGLRKYLTIELAATGGRGVVFESLSRMRRACRAFVDAAGVNASVFVADHAHFQRCLSAFRHAVGNEVGLLSHTFEIPIEQELMSAVPDVRWS